MTQLKSIYTSSCSMGNKKKGLEAIVWQTNLPLLKSREIAPTIGVLKLIALQKG